MFRSVIAASAYRSARPPISSPINCSGAACAIVPTDVASAAFAGASPWRRFGWDKDQKHYSGTYWSAVDGHVIYESRPEVARKLCADFDPSVNRIVARRMLANMSDLRTCRRVRGV